MDRFAMAAALFAAFNMVFGREIEPPIPLEASKPI
jgi:hypothetical protein